MQAEDGNASLAADTAAIAKRAAWQLFLQGISHLKNGAPDGGPGSMAEALAKTSLRSSALAASLGIRPPQFEQMPFPADFTDGAEAARFLCRELAKAARQDMGRSKDIITKKLFTEKPDPAIKLEMARTLDALAEAYDAACTELLNSL